MYMIIRRYFEKYCEELLNRHDLMLCNHFIIKMDDITHRWEGNDAFDDVWFASCENGNQTLDDLMPWAESLPEECYKRR